MTSPSTTPIRPMVASTPDNSDPDGQVREQAAPEDELSADALEAAYLRALEVVEAATVVEGELAAELAGVAAAAGDEGVRAENHPGAVDASAQVGRGQPESPLDGSPAGHTPGVTPKQVVEALLFV